MHEPTRHGTTHAHEAHTQRPRDEARKGDERRRRKEDQPEKVEEEEEAGEKVRAETKAQHTKDNPKGYP